MADMLSERIKKQSALLGFQKTGITSAAVTKTEKANLDFWLEQNHHGTMDWLVKRKKERGDIFTYFPAAKSVISVGMNYFSGFDQDDLADDTKFSNYAWGDDYHQVLKTRLRNLLSWLKSEIPDSNGIVCVDTSPVMEKVWAQRAGLGWQGKHTNLISRDYGSWLFLGELIVDIELDYDPPFTEDLCGSCTACIDTCPTKALGAYEIYAEKCISYLTIEYRGDFSGEDGDLHGWIYGCDICQEVCPWNKKFSQVTTEPSFAPKEEILAWKDGDWERLDEEEFRKLFSGSAVKRTTFSGLKRNIEKNTKEAS